MYTYYDEYQRGHYQEVYEALLRMQDQIFHQEVYEDAKLVMQAMMKRVRFNVELLLQRLPTLGYTFGKGGFWQDLPSQEQAQILHDFPVFQPPTSEAKKKVAHLEELAGALPLSLKYFFEEVGSINFIGLFPENERRYGCVLDPLCIDSLAIMLQMVTNLQQGGNEDLWNEEPLLLLSGDRFHKYGYSGGGSYSVKLPCKAIDAPFLDEPHQTTFVKYLRQCIKWGGLPGLEQECRVTPSQLAYLTKGLLPF